MKRKSYRMGDGLNVHDQCCNNTPVLEVLYKDEKYNEGQPIRICSDHWNQQDENGVKFWQAATKSVKRLVVV